MKRTISLILCMILCLGTVNITVHAEDTKKIVINNSDTTDYISPDAQLTRFLSDKVLTSERTAAAISKHNLGQALASGSGLTRSANVPAKTLNVPWYSQSNGYYCGPATIKQTIQFINGYSATQDQLATALGTSSSYGTDTNNMCVYLNNNTDCYYEVLWWWANAAAFSTMVISNTDDNVPIVGHVIISYKGDWPYTTGGHYINYNGYSEYGEMFDVTDPFVDRFGDTDGKYKISNDEAERVTDRIIW